MPREQINLPKLGLVIDRNGNEFEYDPAVGVPAGGDVFYDPAIHVHWRRPEGPDYSVDSVKAGVQVSLEMPVGFLKNRAERLDEAVITTSIFTDDLSRREINHLIRTLRRARDAAYGSDE
jgi:hypothetical protein